MWQVECIADDGYKGELTKGKIYIASHSEISFLDVKLINDKGDLEEYPIFRFEPKRR